MIYAIGDIHGHFGPLMRLLDKIHYGDSDELWFVGDFVSRGPQQAEVLRFVHGLKNKRVVLGNHDISALVQSLNFPDIKIKPDVQKLLEEDDGAELLDKLRGYEFLVVDAELQVAMSHAGIFPQWSIDEALAFNGELTAQLRGPDHRNFLYASYGDEPLIWNENLRDGARYRFLINAFCRMRYLTSEGHLELREKRPPAEVNKLVPWFNFPSHCSYRQYFGHWASLGDYCHKNIRCLDGGLAWGGKLMAWNISADRLAGEIWATK